MNSGHLELFLKLVSSDYNLSREESTVLKNRMMADDHEFELIWNLYKLKARKTRKGVDPFQSILKELLA